MDNPQIPGQSKFKTDNYFKNIFLEHYDSLLAYGLKLYPDSSVIRDLLQDIFVKFWTNKKYIDKAQNIRIYLFSSLRNAIIDLYRKKRNRVFILKEDFYNTGIMDFSIEDFIIKEETDKEIYMKVTESLNKLPDRQREAIFLRYIEGLDFDEIAEIMSLNIQSVRNHVFRGLSQLREIIGFLVSYGLLFNCFLDF